jgi:beta-galactosidase
MDSLYGRRPRGTRRLTLSRAAAWAVFVSCVSAASVLIASNAAAESVDFRKDWRFTKGDAQGAEQSDYDDGSWVRVRLPHDWAIAGPFDVNAPSGSSAKLPWKGVGWYRKNFDLNRAEGTRVYLDFDGVMAFPKVYVNGKLAGAWDYGYSSFRIDATPFVNLHGRNTVAVRVDTTQHGTRWYPGAGIYRRVSLELRAPVHVAQWGLSVTTPQVSEERAVVAAKATIENHAAEPTPATVALQLLDPTGKTVLERTQDVSLEPGQTELSESFDVENPQRWDIESPQLYTLRTIVRIGDAAVDQQDAHFGIRTIELDSEGLHLNGRRVQLQGVNLHHDLGPLGAAFNTRAVQRQLEIMQDMGVNAIRTAHNPPAPELLDLCDRMGLLVWDECFDKWDATADRGNRGGPSHEEHAERHLRSMVMRDRNHPSVFLWSIGNEIGPGGEGLTPARVAMMRNVVRKYDDTRPVGIACHLPDLGRGEIFDSLDVVGWNYCRHYALYHEKNPDRPIIYSESAAAVSSRGFYELPLPFSKTDYSQQRQVSGYDYNTAPWADVSDREFDLMKQDQFVAGEFVWSGFDYLGEPTPFDNEARSSYFGAVDLCGIPKDRFWLYRSHWRPNEPTVHILPHWNWPEQIGQPVPVFVYTSGDSAELFLNGKSLGRRVKGEAPPRPVNFAATSRVTASSSRPDAPPELAVDGNYIKRWFASSPDAQQWLELDLGEVRPVQWLELSFEREAKRYGYVVKASVDKQTWTDIVIHKASDRAQPGAENAGMHAVDAEARYLRIEIDEVRSVPWARYWPCIREIGVYAEPVESAFYLPTYNYRLRWNAVAYEPGELKAVAYRDGKPLGEAVVRTAQAPAKLKLTPDRTELDATGDDLSYVLVEAFDDAGAPCPLADNLVTFTVEGPAEIAAIGNGNPMSFESFQSDRRHLFNGKAMLIVRTLEGRDGPIRIRASSEGLASAEATCTATAPAR